MASNNDDKEEILDNLKEQAAERMGNIVEAWKQDALKELDNLSNGVAVERSSGIKI